MPRASASAAPRPKSAPAPRAEVRVSTRQRLGASAETDAAAWRRDEGELTGALASLTANREPTANERMRAVRLSRLNYKRSGVYGQVVDTVVNFVLGDGIEVSCDDPGATAFVRKVLDDPENDWDATLRRKVTSLLVDGEYVLSATVPIRGSDAGGPIPAGSVLFGRMEPEAIAKVDVRKLNADAVTGLHFRGDGGGKDFVLPVIGRGVNLLPVEDGLCGVFFWRVNTLGRRGMPYLSRSLDKATMLDATVEALAAKAEYTNRFWMHATYPAEPGDTKEARAKNTKVEEELRAWLESLTPGAVAATSEGVKVQAYTPNLGLPDAKVLVEVLLEYILGSHGIPRMWYSAGGDTNRATAVEQGTPIHRAIDALQAVVRAMLEDVVRFLVRVGRDAGIVRRGPDVKITVTMPDVATRDSIRDVTELLQLVAVLDSYVASGILSAVEAQAIGRRAMRGKSWGDLVTDATAPPRPAEPVAIAPPPPGYRPGQPAPAAPPSGDPGAGAPPPGSGDLPAARNPG